MTIRHFSLCAFYVLAGFSMLAQTNSIIEQPMSVSDSGSDPAASAMFDVQATNKGMLIPRLTTAQRNAIASPAVGLLVFDTNENDFFFRTASAWVSLEAQTLSLSGNALSLSNGGGTVNLDGSTTNEIQTISLSGNALSLSNSGGTVNLDGSTSNEIQTLSISGNNLSISSGNTVALPAASSQWTNCTSDKIAFDSNPTGNKSVGIGACPDDVARLLIKDDHDFVDKTGIKVNFTGESNNRRGAHLRVENGSMTNDGIVLFSKGVNNSTGIVDSVLSGGTDDIATGADIVVLNGLVNYGLKVLVNDGSANNPANGQNIGMRVEVKNNSANSGNGSADNLRDIALYAIAEEKTFDYAAYFEGDVGIPDELEFIDPGTGLQWSIFIAKPSGNPSWYNPSANYCGETNLDDLIFAHETTIKGVMSNSTGTFCLTSDRRLKENIAALPATLPLALQLNPVSFNYIDDKSKTVTVGFIAQDVEPLFPEAVNRVADEKLGEILTLNYDAFSVVAIKALQEQQAVIERQAESLEQLKLEIAEMKAMMQSLMAKQR